jgi:hypothetical protein
MPNLLSAPPRVVNIGLPGFAADLVRNGVAVVDVDWRPPAGGDAALQRLLARLETPEVEAANEAAVGRMLAAEPHLVDVIPAGAAIPALGERMILHAGPPLVWAEMCGPMRGAVAGAIVFEGWAPDLAAAERLAASGAIAFAPNHDHGAVGPMAGITTRSMPLLVVENRAFGTRALATLNEGLGRVLRFGGNDASVLARLAWLRDALGPALGRVLRGLGGVALKPLVARGLAMGDEMHQRNLAASGLLLRALAAPLAREPDGAEALAFLAGNEQFFLNVAMAMAKAIADPARHVPGSTIVTAMARNGTAFAIRVAGAGERWFRAPATLPKGLYFPGYGEADASPDMGDSAIVETVGLGGFAMAASPSVAGLVGAGGMREALEWTRLMAEIAAARNGDWAIPALDGEGVPLGIDVRRVVATGIEPVINTGIAHRQPGIGQVGAGIARAPLACFRAALEAIAGEAAP